MKRSMSLLTASMVFAMVIAGCSSAAESPAETPAETADASPPEITASTTWDESVSPALQLEIDAINSSGETFDYWISLIFSDRANETAVKTVNDWGAAREIKANPILVNGNNLPAQVTASLTAGTMPDAFDTSSALMLQLGPENLLNIQGVYDQLSTALGGVNPGASLYDSAGYSGKGLGIPLGVTGNLLNRRLDLITSKDAPATWEEALTQTMEAAPSGGGFGFNTGNVGDGENTFAVMFHGYGGRIANDAGTECTIDSVETRDFLSFVKKAYDAGAYPAGSSNADGAWDNNQYLGGKVVMIANPGSVYTTLINGSDTWDKNPTLAENTGFSALPGGPVMRVAPADAWLRVVSGTTKYPELAKDLILYLSGIPQMEAYYEHAIYGPAFKGYNDMPFWQPSVDPARSGLQELALLGTSLQFPDVNNTAIAEFTAGFNMSRMVQRVLYDGVSSDTAIGEAQTICAQIYSSY